MTIKCPQCGGTDIAEGEQDFGDLGFMRICKICMECGYEWDFYGDPHPLLRLSRDLDDVLEYIALCRDHAFDLEQEEYEDKLINTLYEVQEFLWKVMNK